MDAAVSRAFVRLVALASILVLAACGGGAGPTAAPAAVNAAVCLPASATCNNLQGYAGNSVAQGTTGATIAGGGQRGAPNRITGDTGTIGGGEGNTAGEESTIAGGASNTAVNFRASVGGGANNVADAWAATVAGGFKNTASDAFATVGGGVVNVASDINATVAGGAGNTATFRYAAVCGGTQNTAGSTAALVAGGERNVGTGAYSAVLGGVNNKADGNQAAIGGGAGNMASGLYSTVPGGFTNQALADYSFAAGSRARVQPDHKGAFLFADAEPAPFESLQPNEFAVRAGGGVRFVTAIDHGGKPLSGVRLSAGSGSWETLSDAASKSGLTATNGGWVLDRLANLPIETWSYRAEDPSVKHIGPTAQDFRAAFGLGEGDNYISTVDADGVALSAIQELYRRTQESAPPADMAVLERRLALANTMSVVSLLVAAMALWRARARSG